MDNETEAINERMVGWTINKVELGTSDENLYIFHLSKGANKRSVILCGNDLGAWLSPRSYGPKKRKH